MSVHELPSGKWKVRWRTPEGTARSKTFSACEKSEAVAFETEILKAKRLGSLIHLQTEIDGSKKSLREVGAEFWQTKYHNLAPKTREHYKWLIETLVAPDGGELTDSPIGAISTTDVEDWLTGLPTGNVAKRHAASLLSSIFKFAMRRGYVKWNPALIAERPKKAKRKIVYPATPAEIEAIRAKLDDESKLLVSLMAYQGLRPQEALGLRWEDVQKTTLLVYAPKTDTVRAVRLLGVVADELAAFRLKAGNVTGFIFHKDGQRWQKHDYNNWRRRKWGKVSTIGHPYVLRHSFISGRIGQGDPLTEVAAEAGHSVQTCSEHYAHAFKDYDPENRVRMEDAIRAARNGGTNLEEQEGVLHVS